MAGVEAIDAALQGGVEDGTFPGAVLAVRHQGVLVYERAVGQRALAPSPASATTQTLMTFLIISYNAPVAYNASKTLVLHADDILKVSSRYLCRAHFRDDDQSFPSDNQ